MVKPLPSVPAEVLDISTEDFRRDIFATVEAAEQDGRWQRPFQGAAANFDELTLEDIYYWVYKSRNPITQPEDGMDVDVLLNRDPSTIALPDNFQVDSQATMGIGGDLLRSPGTEHSKDILFEKVAPLLFDQDLSYANFESPVTTGPLREELIGDKAAPLECCSPEQFDTFKGHKGKTFTVLNTTNNHSFDMGLEGIETTWRMMDENGILDSGTNRRPEDLGTCKTLEINGIKIGFVATTYGLNGHQIPEAEAYRINVSRIHSKFAPPDMSLVEQQIDDAKAQGCDVIVASIHWGYEFEFFPRIHQVQIAHDLVEYGADMIIGNHPHALQPIDYYRTKRDPNRVAIITYALGTLTWGFTAPHIVLCALLNLTLSKGKLGGETRTYITASRATPVFRSCVVEDDRWISRIEPLADHVDGKINAHPKEYIDTMAHYAKLILG
ncbi:CapA family protein [Rhodospirillum sp. A1_3_36]|uniref:CapA family protein n=1 Tax=Rhodospirillum sp. A1_3_36 TaxID=3391666 RepID=UPI0039A49486